MLLMSEDISGLGSHGRTDGTAIANLILDGKPWPRVPECTPLSPGEAWKAENGFRIREAGSG